jgi:hypothetical protein
MQEIVSERFEALNEIGIHPDEVEEFINIRDLRQEVQREVCICGHAINKHDGMGGNVICVTARMWRPCTTPHAVLNVQDTRYFMTRTYGAGRKHALATGLHRLGKKGKWAKWIVEPKCAKCGANKNPVYPTAIDETNRVSRKPTSRNFLLCGVCLEELGGSIY